MDIELKSTVYNKGRSSSVAENHQATFGIYNELDRNGGMQNFVTLGVLDGDDTASIDIQWEEFEAVYDLLSSARLK